LREALVTRSGLIPWVLAAFLGLSLLASFADAHAAPTPDPYQPEWQWRYQVWMPMHWQRLARCESGTNPPNWKHHDGYEGAFGFDPGTWDDYRYAGYPHAAYLATPWQQYRVARRIAARFRSIGGSWGCWRGRDHAWVRGGLSERGTWQ
jgi:hypothetical protein